MSTHYQGTESERLALDAYIKLSRAAEATGRRINDYLHERNLTTSQFGVLEALYHLGPMPVGRVGEKILRSSANMTLVIENLVRRGLVARTRPPEDRRAIVVDLTDEGRVLIAGLMPDHVAGVVAAFECLTAGEQATLAALCRKLGQANSHKRSDT
jgi:MarR family transcriptional regulator, 2-MHQ and catechol-resistance regulon repressor